MTDFFTQYELERHTSSWGGFRTGWWFGFYGNIPGAGVATVYAISNERVPAVANCFPVLYLNTKDTNFAAGGAVDFGTAGEEYSIEFRPRISHQGIFLSENVLSPWVKLFSEQSGFQVGIAADGELYVCGMQMLRFIDPQYVCIPVPEATDSSDEAIPAGTKPARFTAIFPNGGNGFFRITTSGFGTKWVQAEGRRESNDTVSPSTLIALDKDGNLYSCGQSGIGLLGLGSANHSAVTLTRIGTNSYSFFSLSRSHCMAIQTDNVLKVWGNTQRGSSVANEYSTCGLSRTPRVLNTFEPTEITGIVREVTITNEGSGYTATPSVTFAGACDQTAVATAVRNTSTNKIEKISITEGGRGYTAAPTITIGSPAGTHVQAQASCSISTAFTHCFAGVRWSLAIDCDGYALAAGHPAGGSQWTDQKDSDFAGRRSFRPVPAPVSFAKCRGGDGDREVAFFFTEQGDAYGIGRNNVGQLAAGYTSSVKNSVVSSGTSTTWITMIPVSNFGVDNDRFFGISNDGNLYAWGKVPDFDASEQRNSLALQDVSAITATAIAIPLPAGPVGDKWKSISGAGATVFIRDDDASPEVDYA